MLENKNLREEKQESGDTTGVYDVDYFRTKYNLTTDEVIAAIKEAKTENPLVLDEYFAGKYSLPEDNPDRGTEE